MHEKFQKTDLYQSFLAQFSDAVTKNEFIEAHLRKAGHPLAAYYGETDMLQNFPEEMLSEREFDALSSQAPLAPLPFHKKPCVMSGLLSDVQFLRTRERENTYEGLPGVALMCWWQRSYHAKLNLI